MIIPLECPLVVSGPVPFHACLAPPMLESPCYVKDRTVLSAKPADACGLPQVYSSLLKVSRDQAVSAASSAPVEGGAHTHGRLLCSSCTA